MTPVESFSAFLVVAALMTVTPGVDTALVVRTAIADGGKAAFSSALGISAGCMVWGVVVSVGLGALIVASPLAFEILKWAGAAYLTWLAIGLLRGSRTVAPADGQFRDRPVGRMARFRVGLLTNLLNPKAGLFYITLLPQFIPDKANPGIFSLGLALTHALLGLGWFGLIIGAAERVQKVLRRPFLARSLDRMTACVFVLFAAKLVAAKR